MVPQDVGGVIGYTVRSEIGVLSTEILLNNSERTYVSC
jgi:hypothetical protein